MNLTLSHWYASAKMAQQTRESTGIPAFERLVIARGAILPEWERLLAATSTPAEQGVTRAVQSRIPALLDQLTSELRDLDRQRSARVRVSSDRDVSPAAELAPHVSLRQVVREYDVLRRVLLHALEADDGALEAKERDLLLDVISNAIQSAAVELERAREARSASATQQLEQTNLALSAALEESSTQASLKQQLLTTLFERVEDYAIFTLDAGGYVTSWAIGAQKMKLFLPEEIIGRHFSMLYPEEGRIRNDPMNHLAIAARKGRFRGEGLRERKNGEPFLADVFITPMYEAGRVSGFFKIVADLSERGRLLQERDLSRARTEMLEVQTARRERFLYTLSHDLRNPLAAVKLRMEQLERSRCNVAQHQALAARSLAAIERADQMITDLLDAGRMHAGESFALHLTEYDLTVELKTSCEDAAAAHGERFLLQAPPSLVGHWDRQALRRVFENLVSNALKYGAANGLVTVTLSSLGDRALLTVHNEGASIDPSDQEALFELFRRSPSAEVKSGWGIGLTLVRGIVEAHGGFVTVRSLPGEGTSFTLDLPRDARTKLSAS